MNLLRSPQAITRLNISRYQPEISEEPIQTNSKENLDRDASLIEDCLDNETIESQQHLQLPRFEEEANLFLQKCASRESAATLLLINKYARTQEEAEVWKKFDLVPLIGNIIHVRLGLPTPGNNLPSVNRRTPPLTSENLLDLILFFDGELFPLIEHGNYHSIAGALLKIFSFYPLSEKLKEYLTQATQRAIINGNLIEKSVRAKQQINIMEREIPARRKIEAAFNSIISEIHQARGDNEPTKQEQILETIRSQDNFCFELEDLESIFVGADTNPVRLAQKKISELNEKLKSFGIQIERDKRYRITKL